MTLPLRSPEGRRALAALAARGALVGLDFDGTLAPIVADPAAAAMSATTAAALADVCRRYPVAVISGRAHGDVARRVAAAAPRWIIGSHGAQRDGGGGTLAPLWARIIRARLGDAAGFVVEEKGASVAVHYRHVGDPEEGRARARAAVAGLLNARIIEGIFVVDVVLASAPDKGEVFAALCREERADACLFVGDDTTDEAVFERPDLPAPLTVVVGRTRGSAARFRLGDQPEIDWLLQELLALR